MSTQCHRRSQNLMVLLDPVSYDLAGLSSRLFEGDARVSFV